MGDSDILAVLTNTCENLANLFLDCPSTELDEETLLASDLTFAVERRDWIGMNGDEDPAGWIGKIVISYLAESSHQLKALALLLRERAVHATLDPLIRAVIERCGRVCWILDPCVTLTQRGARTQLELGVCALHYAEAMVLLEASDETREELRGWRGDHRRRVHDRFTVETNGSKKDMSDWSVDGETYPGYTEVVAFALDGHEQAKGVYAGLSGFSHPNVFFASERQHQTVVSRNVMVMHTDALERTLRIAIAAYLAAVKHWAAYFLDKELAAEIVVEGDRLADDLDAASVLEDIPDTSHGS